MQAVDQLVDQRFAAEEALAVFRLIGGQSFVGAGRGFSDHFGRQITPEGCDFVSENVVNRRPPVFDCREAESLFDDVVPGGGQGRQATARCPRRWRRLSRQHVPQNSSCGVDIRCRRNVPTGLDLLGCLVQRRPANEGRQRGRFGDVFGNAKVADQDAFVDLDQPGSRCLAVGGLGLPVGGPSLCRLEQDVGGFDVAVHDARLVNGRESVREGIDQDADLLRI